MIIDLIEGDHQLPDYNLGGREPSDEVKQVLLKMRVPIRAIWCNDKHRWLLYRIKDTNLHFQREAPEGDLTIGITGWLEQFDDTEHGRWGDEDSPGVQSGATRRGHRRVTDGHGMARAWAPAAREGIRGRVV